MNATTKLALYSALLVASFALAAGLGAVAGPIDTGDAAELHNADAAGHEAPASSMSSQRPGTSLDASGYRMVPAAREVTANQSASYSFVIVDDAGRPVTEFDQLHERELHLIVASRDLVAYHHLHPTRDNAGTWSINLPALPSGSYRVFADAAPSGATQVTLGHDLTVAEVVTTSSPPLDVTTSAVHGFDVSMVIATSEAVSSTYEFVVERDGATVTPEPYLGALGHLVALRQGDLAYVHVHAAETAGPAIGFGVDFPTPGTYRLFLDFSVDGTVHTADFTVEAPQHTADAMKENTNHDTGAPESSDDHSDKGH